MASVRTHSVPQVQDTATHSHERLNIHECEAMQGWPPGISGGFRSPLGTSYSQRLSHIGNALNGHQCYQILRHLKPGPVASANVHSMCFEKMTSAQVEQQFSQMTSAQLVDCFRKRAFGRKDGWKPAPLTLRLKPGQKPYAKPRRGHTCPSGLTASRDYMLQEQIRKGYMEEVPYDSKYFISQGVV